MFRLGIKSHFDSAHRLEGYRGECSKLHGHRWEIEAIIKGEELDDLGMLADFKEIKKIMSGLIRKLDHELLNQVDILSGINPTAENLAYKIFLNLEASIPHKITLEEVRVWESPDCWASYRK
ncbi:MAG: 6-carboxytetrahydropterin synthase QueD [Vulcanimicrobiota bacterium]